MLKKRLTKDWKIFQSKTYMYSGVIGISAVIAQFFGLLFLVIIARFYSQADYGYINYVIQIGGLAATVVAAGFPSAMARFLSRSENNQDKLDRYFSNIFTLTGGLLVITVLAMIGLYGFDIGIISIVIGYSIAYMYLGLNRGLLNYKKIAAYNLLSSLFKILPLLLLCLIFLDKSFNYVLLIYAFAPCLAIFAIEGLISTKIHYSRKYVSGDIIKEVVVFSVPVMISTLGYTALSSIPVLAIKHFYDYQLVGIYSVAITVSVVFTFVPEAINVIMMPAVSRSNNRKSRIELVTQSIWIVLLTGIILYSALLIVGKPFLVMVFTEKYVESYPILVIMAAGAILAGIRNVFCSLWEGSGHPAIATLDICVAAAICTGVGIWLLPGLGPIGAAYGYTLGLTCAVLIDGYFWVRYRYLNKIDLEK